MKAPSRTPFKMNHAQHDLVLNNMPLLVGAVRRTRHLWHGLGLSFDEAFADAQLVACLATRSFSPLLSEWSTYVYVSTERYFIARLKQQKRRQEKFSAYLYTQYGWHN